MKRKLKKYLTSFLDWYYGEDEQTKRVLKMSQEYIESDAIQIVGRKKRRHFKYGLFVCQDLGYMSYILKYSDNEVHFYLGWEDRESIQTIFKGSLNDMERWLKAELMTRKLEGNKTSRQQRWLDSL